MNRDYNKLTELIDNNGGLLNDESLHFIARHGLLCELLLCDNRLGEEAFLALPAMGYAPNSNELACYLYMRDALDCKMMSALNLSDAVMLELLCLDLSLLPAARAKGVVQGVLTKGNLRGFSSTRIARRKIPSLLRSYKSAGGVLWTP